MRITDGFIIKEITDEQMGYWVHVRHWKIVEPVEIPAPEIEQELPLKKAAKPEQVVEPVKKVKKVVKDVTR